MYEKFMDTIGFVSEFDPDLGAMMGRELGRQQDGLELIASENFTLLPPPLWPPWVPF